MHDLNSDPWRQQNAMKSQGERLPVGLFALMATCALLTIASITWAQSASPRSRASSSSQSRSTVEPTPPAPAPPVVHVIPVEDPTARVEELYLRLFELKTELSREDRRAVRDSLREEVDRLHEEISRYHLELSEELEDAEREELDSEVLELRDLIDRRAAEGDWESFNNDLGELLETVKGFADEFGETFGDIEIDVSGDRFRIATESGSRLEFRISEELRENLGELGTVLSDSTIHAITKGIELPLPEDIKARIANRRARANESKKKWRVIGRSIFVIGREVTVADDELVKGDVIVVFGDVDVQGKVMGKTMAIFGGLNIDEDAVIERDAISIGGRVQMEQGGSVGGQVIDVGRTLPGGAESMRGAAPFLLVLGLGIRLAMLVLLAIILIAMVGDRLEVMVQDCSSNVVRSFGLGLIWLLAAIPLTLIASVALGMTIIGIPVVVLLVLAMAALLLSAYYVTCRVLGDRVFRMMGRSEDAPPWMSTMLGIAMLEAPTILVMALAFIFSPDGSANLIPVTADLTLKLLVTAAGFGSLVRTRFGGAFRSSRLKTPPTAEPTSA